MRTRSTSTSFNLAVDTKAGIPVTSPIAKAGVRFLSGSTGVSFSWVAKQCYWMQDGRCIWGSISDVVQFFKVDIYALRTTPQLHNPGGDHLSVEFFYNSGSRAFCRNILTFEVALINQVSCGR